MTKRRGAARFGQALRALVKALAIHGTPVAIIGGIALNASGVVRFTADIDATIPGADLDLRGLLRTLAAHGIVPRIPDAVGFARRNQVLLLKHAATGLELDVSLAWIAFELEAIARGRAVRFGTATIRVARPEDLVIYKLIANRPRDRDDLERLLLARRADIDLSRVRKVLRTLSEFLEGEDRLATLAEVVAALPEAPASTRRLGAKAQRTRRRRA